jgi:hypothetical protein
VPFIVELNRRRYQHQIAVTSLYEQTVSLALEVLVQSLKAGDKDLALVIFRTVGRQLADARASSNSQTVSGVILSLADQRERESLKQLLISQSHIKQVEEESHLRND